MTNDLMKIEYFYNQAIIALKQKDFKIAASFFRQCYETYEAAELPMFDNEIKNIGEDAMVQYNFIVINYLDESGFDEIQYEN